MTMLLEIARAVESDEEEAANSNTHWAHAAGLLTAVQIFRMNPFD